MSALDRRTLLTGTLAAVSGAVLAPSWLTAAARQLPAGTRRLVVLELFGGNDGLNTLVPFEDDRYHRARPTLALTRKDVLVLDELNGLHRTLARTRRWYDAGCVAIVRDVGYPEPNLSHFASRDVWSCAASEVQPRSEGWLGRGAQAGGLAELGQLALGSDVAPRLMRGAGAAPSAVPDLASFRFDLRGTLSRPEGEARLRAFARLGESEAGAGTETAYVSEALGRARRASELLSRAPRASRPAEYPGGTLGRDLAAVADVIAADLPSRLFHVQHQDYDTHTRQAGRQAQLLAELDLAVDAFLRDLRAQGRLEETLVLVVSEFGRRVAESGIGGDAGTDHGAASLTLLLGGAVRGGLHGEQPDLEHLDEVGNQPYRVDFRSVLRCALEDWLGLDARVVLGASWPRLELLSST